MEKVTNAHEQDTESKARDLDTVRDLVVSAYTCATRLQAAMRGRAERKKAEKRKKKGKGKKKH